MKSVKNLIFALLLVFAATANVAAGETPIPPAPSPDPTRATATTNTTQPSLGLNSVQSGETVETDYLLFEALAALLTIY